MPYAAHSTDIITNTEDMLLSKIAKGRQSSLPKFLNYKMQV
ncbi:hypothetical protein P4S68_06785 [Pseudoalteromonas sp. Hal099]